jgi:hypothetical protein
MEPIRIEYETRPYTVCLSKNNNQEVLIRTVGGLLIARLAPNGGACDSKFQVRGDGYIVADDKTDDKTYGWLDNLRCVTYLPKILELAVREASGDDAQKLAKAHNLAKTLESVV